jgi:transcription-repair coupling factor (superfamily II helicase)
MAVKPSFLSLPVERLLKAPRMIASGVPEGLDALVLGELARQTQRGAPILHIARDANRLVTLEDALAFFAPDVTVLTFPAWDGVPYDRVAPNADTIARRIATLSELTHRETAGNKSPLIVLTTVNAVVQRVPPRAFIAASSMRLAPGNAVSMQELVERLEVSGYGRAGTVTDPGQYAVRGGILDLYPPAAQPVRLDFFGDTLESIRAFDPETQRTAARLDTVELLPMSELVLTPDVRRAFRQRYVELFGPVTGDDPLYESISAGRQHQGMEHWLPLFHDRLNALFDYLPAVVSLDPLVDDARTKRLEQVADHYEARAQALERKAFGAPPYHPVPPESLFLSKAEWEQALAARQTIALDPFEHPETPGGQIVSFGGRQGRSFAAERQTEGANLFDAVVAHAKRLKGEDKRVIVACWSNGARERLATLLWEHGVGETKSVETFTDALALPHATTAFAVLPLETGF